MMYLLTLSGQFNEATDDFSSVNGFEMQQQKRTGCYLNLDWS